MTWDAKRGESIRRGLVEGDLVANFVSDWRRKGPRFDTTAPDEERARQRRDLAQWLAGEAKK